MKLRITILLMAAFVALGVASGPVRASETDERIEAAARQSYVFKTYLKDDDIKVQSNNGAVTLTGVVSGEYHKSLAQETVAGLPGVKSVDDRLTIKGDSSTAYPDVWLREKVRFTLLFHRSVSAAKTEVEVKDGTATLRGDATSEAQKELTTEYVKDVVGIKDVKNEMTVAGVSEATPRTMGDKIDDASITAQAKISLLLHRSTSALKTTVSTKDGVVTVSGEAKNAAEKALVTKLVDDVNGVSKVDNRMTVAKSESK